MLCLLASWTIAIHETPNLVPKGERHDAAETYMDLKTNRAFSPEPRPRRRLKLFLVTVAKMGEPFLHLCLITT